MKNCNIGENCKRDVIEPKFNAEWRIWNLRGALCPFMPLGARVCAVWEPWGATKPATTRPIIVRFRECQIGVGYAYGGG